MGRIRDAMNSAFSKRLVKNDSRYNDEQKAAMLSAISGHGYRGLTFLRDPEYAGEGGYILTAKEMKEVMQFVDAADATTLAFARSMPKEKILWVARVFNDLYDPDGSGPLDPYERELFKTYFWIAAEIEKITGRTAAAEISDDLSQVKQRLVDPYARNGYQAIWDGKGFNRDALAELQIACGEHVDVFRLLDSSLAPKQMEIIRKAMLQHVDEKALDIMCDPSFAFHNLEYHNGAFFIGGASEKNIEVSLNKDGVLSCRFPREDNWRPLRHEFGSIKKGDAFLVGNNGKVCIARSDVKEIFDGDSLLGGYVDATNGQCYFDDERMDLAREFGVRLKTALSQIAKPVEQQFNLNSLVVDELGRRARVMAYEPETNKYQILFVDPENFDKDGWYHATQLFAYVHDAPQFKEFDLVVDDTGRRGKVLDYAPATDEYRIHYDDGNVWWASAKTLSPYMSKAIKSDKVENVDSLLARATTISEQSKGLAEELGKLRDSLSRQEQDLSAD